MSGPLAGLRVVDLTRVLAGPFGTTILGDLGADVVKVEFPGKGEVGRHIAPYVNGQSHYFLSLNRNKRSLAVDFRTPAGKEVLRRLIGRADVLMENFRPGLLDRFGLGPETLRAEYPSLVICSISGFGQRGPMSQTPSFDLVTQALSGAMSITGEPGRPPVRLGIPMGDLIGGFYGSIAVLAALRDREKTGQGTHIDLSLHDGLVSLLGYMAGRYFATGEVLGPPGSGHATSVPYQAYEAADGYLVIACMSDNFWPKTCAAVGVPELAADPELASYDQRTVARDRVNAAIGAAVRQKTVAQWCEIFEAQDIPHGPVLDIAGVLAHPQLAHRQMIQEFTHPEYGSFKTLANPMRFDDRPNDPISPPPLLGEHSTEILDGLGYSAEEIAALRDQGVLQ